MQNGLQTVDAHRGLSVACFGCLVYLRAFAIPGIQRYKIHYGGLPRLLGFLSVKSHLRAGVSGRLAKVEHMLYNTTTQQVQKPLNWPISCEG